MITRSHQRSAGMRKSSAKTPPISPHSLAMRDEKKYLKEGTVKPFLYGRPDSTYYIIYDPIVQDIPNYVQKSTQTGARTVFSNTIITPYIGAFFSTCLFFQMPDDSTFHPIFFSTTSSESPQSGGYLWLSNADLSRVRFLGHFADSSNTYDIISFSFSGSIDLSKVNFLGFSYRASDGRFSCNLNGEIQTHYDASLGELLHANPKPVTVGNDRNGDTVFGAYQLSEKYMTDVEIDGFFNKYRHIYGI